MDDLLVDGKKYISSKVAAKLTGYAKDYVGQLCREGRVPARLIGRSWYVLESAIQDHRFGTPLKETREETRVQSKSRNESGEDRATRPTWEEPRYESSSDPLLPTTKSMQDTVAAHSVAEQIESTWQEWFSLVKNNTEENMENDSPEVAETVVEKEEIETDAIQVAVRRETEEEHSPRPLVRHDSDSGPEDAREMDTVSRQRSVSPPLARRLYPKAQAEEVEESQADREESRTKSRSGGVLNKAVMIISLVVTVLAALLVLVNSGKFDTYIASFNRATEITGISVYEK